MNKDKSDYVTLKVQVIGEFPDDVEPQDLAFVGDPQDKPEAQKEEWELPPLQLNRKKSEIKEMYGISDVMFKLLDRDQKNKIKELGKFEMKGKIANIPG